MKDIRNLWGEIIETQLELCDINVGDVCKVNGHGKPHYLIGDTVTVIKKGRKKVVVQDATYPDELITLSPYMLTMGGGTDG